MGSQMHTVSQLPCNTFQRGDTLLVLSPTFSGNGPATCSELLAHDENVEEHVLCITFTRSPAGHLVNWRRNGYVPDRATFVHVTASSQSKTGFDAATIDRGPDDTEVSVAQVSSAENLTRLGVRITDRLEAVTDEVTDHDVRVCFDSVTTLLQYVGVDEAFRFLHVLTDRFSAAETRAHFHMDPGAHDEETIQKLLTVFDEVHEARAFEDDEWVQR